MQTNSSFRQRAAGVIAVAAWSLTIAPAAAQDHFDIHIFAAPGSEPGVDQIGVGTWGCSDFDCTTGDPGQGRVFTNVFTGDSLQGNPGFNTGSSLLPGQLDIEWDFLPMTLDSGPNAGLESALFYWDGLGEDVEFGPTPTSNYALSFTNDNFQSSAAGSGTEIVPGFAAVRTDPSGFVHDHGFFFLDEDTTTFGDNNPDPGVYLVAWQLSAEGFETSDPLFLLYRTIDPSLAPALTLAEAWVDDLIDVLVGGDDGLPGDINGDGAVDLLDLDILGANFGADPATASQGDLNGDAVVDLLDLDILGANFGATAAATAVPEPMAATLLTLACFAGVGTRRQSPQA